MSSEPRRRSSPASPPTAHHRRTLLRARIRGVIAIMLFVTWLIVALTGFLLYLAPTGRRSG